VPLEYQGGAWEQVALELMQKSPAKKRIGDILLCTPVELAIFTWRIIREKGCRCVLIGYTPAAMSYSFNSSLIWTATRRAKPKAECYYSRGAINEEGVGGWRQVPLGTKCLNFSIYLTIKVVKYKNKPDLQSFESTQKGKTTKVQANHQLRNNRIP
jgi:ABC-type enterobactin transport system permease subunit